MKRLPGLNGLRAIAASTVFIGHAYQILGIYYSENATRIFHIIDLGAGMVNLFFVISGFIITYLLMNEYAVTGKVNKWVFFGKRVRRILPLYFLVYGFVFILSNTTTLYHPINALSTSGIPVFALFLVNYNAYFATSLSVLPHYWSLSVEEQFYLGWPFLFTKWKPKFIALTVLIGALIIRNMSAWLAHHDSGNPYWSTLNSVMVTSNFGAIAIGALGALYHKDSRGRFIVFHPFSQLVAWILFAWYFIKGFNIPYINFEITELIFLVLILNLTMNPKSILSLENKTFNQVGTISYGIYMYHWPILPLLISLLNHIGLMPLFSSFYYIPFVLFGYAVVYLISFCSYHFFELKFIKKQPSTKRSINDNRVATVS